jgi:hypothetical protein
MIDSGGIKIFRFLGASLGSFFGSSFTSDMLSERKGEKMKRKRKRKRRMQDLRIGGYLMSDSLSP